MYIIVFTFCVFIYEFATFNSWSSKKMSKQILIAQYFAGELVAKCMLYLLPGNFWSKHAQASVANINRQIAESIYQSGFIKLTWLKPGAIRICLFSIFSLHYLIFLRNWLLLLFLCSIHNTKVVVFEHRVYYYYLVAVLTRIQSSWWRRARGACRSLTTVTCQFLIDARQWAPWSSALVKMTDHPRRPYSFCLRSKRSPATTCVTNLPAPILGAAASRQRLLARKSLNSAVNKIKIRCCEIIQSGPICGSLFIAHPVSVCLSVCLSLCLPATCHKIAMIYWMNECLICVRSKTA